MSTRQTTRRRRRKPGDLRQLRAVLWEVLLEVEAIATGDEADTAEKIRAAHGLASLAGSYAKIVEAVDLDARITALEQAAEQQGMRA